MSQRRPNSDDSQPESIGVPEYRVTVTSVARNGESLDRGRLHENDNDDDGDDHRKSVLFHLSFCIISIQFKEVKNFPK